MQLVYLSMLQNISFFDFSSKGFIHMLHRLLHSNSFFSPLFWLPDKFHQDSRPGRNRDRISIYHSHWGYNDVHGTRVHRCVQMQTVSTVTIVHIYAQKTSLESLLMVIYILPHITNITLQLWKLYYCSSAKKYHETVQIPCFTSEWGPACWA